MIPDSNDLQFMNFYIQKKEYVIINHMIGLNLETISEQVDVVQYIKDNIDDWVFSYNCDLEKLETEE